MSQTVITKAFEEWKARQGESGEPVLLDEFVLANVPGLDPAKPISRDEVIPPASQIVHRLPVTRKGVVNKNAVVHSAVIGADVGDFTFNWIGLINKASGTLAMIVHAPAQQKLKTREGQQGNVLTRSFLMEYSGAQKETGINTPAETWQIDFTARLAAIDERKRVENADIYGGAAFFGDGWLVARSGSQYYVTAGAGYVSGLRAALAANQNITVPAKATKVWLDVCWSGALTSAWNVVTDLVVADSLANYARDGVQHYVFALASIDAAGNITDLRPKGSLDSQQGRNDFMRRDKNLSDVTDAAQARKNLALKGAALMDVGKVAGSVAAGDDSRITEAVQRGGDTMRGELKIRAVNALRIFDNDYGLIFRRSEEYLHLIPTEAGKGENGDLSQLRPLAINLKTGEINFNHKINTAAINAASLTTGKGVFNSIETNALSVGNLVLSTDGNIYGPIWGGWLSNWINSALNSRDQQIALRATYDWANQAFASRDSQINVRATYDWVNQTFAPRNNFSASSNGWSKDVSTGKITQWGFRESRSTAIESAGFNFAFPNACLAVVATLGTAAAPGATVYTALGNNQGFNYRTSGASLGFTFWAVGY